MHRYLAILFLIVSLPLVGCGTDDPQLQDPPGEEPACRADADCPSSAPACVDGACAGCTDHAACAGRKEPRCDGLTGTCVACVVDADCADGYCVGQACVECRVSSDCPTGLCVEGACDLDSCRTDEECAAGDLCILGGTDAAFGSCAPPCDPYAADCAAGRLCALVGFGQDARPVGACLPPIGGAGVQEDCSAADCEADLLCVGYGGADQRCSALCDPAVTDACGAGFECSEVAVAGATVGVCTPVLALCASDADCSADEVCTVANAADGGLDQVCVPAVGMKRAGESCTASAECASNFCLQDQQICYGTCVTHGDCADGTTCVEATFPNDTASACFRSCADDDACSGAQTCTPVISFGGADVTTVCAGAIGSLGAGAPCSSSATCRSGLCSNGFCFGVCDGDDDCNSPITECVSTAFQLSLGPDNTFGTTDDVWASVGTCHGVECTSNAECTGSAVCRLMPDPSDTTRSLADQRCVGAVGPLRGGLACATAADCGTGICFDPRLVPEDCNDGVDNDGDGAVDCDDSDCHEACFTELDCGDGIDNDGDDATDCADGDCKYACALEGHCSNGIDDNGNGLTDCDDPDCAFECGLVERNCTDGIDDDGDGFIDCRDTDCSWSSACRENVTPANCSDGVDNDRDGYIDCQDPDCRFIAPCDTIVHEGSGAASLCTDGLDNDGDGLIDCDDPGCALVVGCTETSCGTSNCCADGLDNDGDGRADCLDIDCAHDPACNESAFCDDGLDNDGDGLIDCHDDDCAEATKCNERRCAAGNCCADGIDNDGDGGMDCVDADCFGDAACAETACANGNCCGDGLDNDGDGAVDCADWDCRFMPGCRETSCSDRMDNDQDGLVDCEDPDCLANSTCAARVCFEACVVEADCLAGMSCVADTAWASLNNRSEDYGYAAACVEASAP